MARPTLPDQAARTSAVRRIMGQTPIVIGVYAAASLALGIGFANPVFDAVGLAATATGYLAGDRGIRSVTSHMER